MVSPSAERSSFKPQRPQRGGTICARTSSARMSEAQRTTYGTRSWVLIGDISVRIGDKRVGV
jgi:hypothetical protein